MAVVQQSSTLNEIEELLRGKQERVQLLIDLDEFFSFQNRAVWKFIVNGQNKLAAFLIVCQGRNKRESSSSQQAQSQLSCVGGVKQRKAAIKTELNRIGFEPNVRSKLHFNIITLYKLRLRGNTNL